MNLSFVIIAWNSVDYIENCLYSYAQSVVQQGLNAEFIVIDNGSCDRTVPVVEMLFAQGLPAGCEGKLLRLSRNWGTTFSRNLGLRQAKGDFIVICDSDTSFIRGSWKACLAICNDSSIGIVAPLLLFETAQVQRSVKKFPTFFEKMSKVMGGRSRGHGGALGNDHYAGFPGRKNELLTLLYRLSGCSGATCLDWLGISMRIYFILRRTWIIV